MNYPPYWTPPPQYYGSMPPMERRGITIEEIRAAREAWQSLEEDVLKRDKDKKEKEKDKDKKFEMPKFTLAQTLFFLCIFSFPFLMLQISLLHWAESLLK